MMPFEVEMQNGPKFAKCCCDGSLPFLLPAPATPASPALAA